MPPIATLSAFEAVVRRGGFTAAANELALTQSAVSRQVNALENLLGVQLLEPNRRRNIVLTPSGVYYADRIRRILSELAAATAEAIALSDRGWALHIGIPPTFGSRWLIPRMQSFFETHPDVAVEFSTNNPLFPHSGLGNLHALIDFSTSPGTDAEWERLIQLELLPVATKEVAEAVRSGDPAAIANLHLLVQSYERNNLAEVFEDPVLASLNTKPLLTFENYMMLIQAGIGGIGVAIAPKALIESDLAAGRLVPVTDLSTHSNSVGYMVYQTEMASYPPLVEFRNWLLSEIAASQADAGGGNNSDD